MSCDSTVNMQLVAKQPHVGFLVSYFPSVVVKLDLSLSLVLQLEQTTVCTTGIPGENLS